MDYISVLGPIDPQVRNKEGSWVAALGYLDKVNDFIKKAQKGKLTHAEVLILKDFDLAELKSYEDARDLAIDLLKKWLVEYKFKNWKKHRTNPPQNGENIVTPEEKKKRAEEIAIALSDNNKWKSHGRPINIESLKKLRLEIIDYSNDEKRELIIDYYNLFIDYVSQKGFKQFIHTKNIF